MSNCVNQVTLIGHIGKAPELKEIGSTTVTNLSIATNHKVKKNNEYVEKTEWHRITCFGNQANFICNYANQGTLVYIDGRLQTRSYESDGQTKYVTEIIANRISILSKGKEVNHEPSQPVQPSEEPITARQYQASKQGFDEDIPF